MIEAYEYIAQKFPDNQAVKNELTELYFEQGIKRAKELGPAKKEPPKVTATIEQISPHLAEQYLEHAIATLKGIEATERIIMEEKVTPPLLHEVEIEKPEETTDSLTGLHDYKYLNSYLEVKIREAEYKKLAMPLIFLDINKFNDVNISFGSSAGDEILIQLAKILKTNTRPEDMLFRYNGDEFALLLTGIEKEEALSVGERLKGIIKDYTFKHGIRLTVNTGIAAYPEDANTSQLLLELARKGIGIPEKVHLSIHSPKLIGRERELKELEDVFKQVMQGDGKVIFISGAAGVGKTRLANEFLDIVKFKGAQILATSCYALPSTPYEPFKIIFTNLYKSGRLSKNAQKALGRVPPFLLSHSGTVPECF
ncbi:MAG: diguanylate cyclase [bacterium]|nr:diguanylate cyclase [bacterium]